MTDSEAARAWLRASLAAGWFPEGDRAAERRGLYEDIMRGLERKHERVAELAIVGTAADLGPLSAGEREHQRHLQREEGLTLAHVREMRRQLRRPQRAGRPPDRKPQHRRELAAGGLGYVIGASRRRGGGGWLLLVAALVAILLVEMAVELLIAFWPVIPVLAVAWLLRKRERRVWLRDRAERAWWTLTAQAGAGRRVPRP